MKIKVKKANGSFEEFNEDKIISSCMSAGASYTLASKIASEIKEKSYDGTPTKEIRSRVYDILSEIESSLADRYIYRSKMRVRTSKTMLEPFDAKKIADSLVKETNLNREHAEKIAHAVEKELGHMRLNYVTAPLIREIVNVKLLESGMENTRARYTRLGMPVHDVKNLIEHGWKLNGNTQYNPETLHKLMADQISREYTLLDILPIDLADAHMAGEIHIHDMDYFSTRPYSFSHDIRFFLKKGLLADGVGMYTAVAGPAKKPEVAFLHAAKVLAASQTNCAGGQGLNYFNVFMAPYVRGLSYEKVKQLAQMFVYEMGQMYVARGGQIVLSSIDLSIETPKPLENTPVIQPGGKVDELTTYSNFIEETRTLFNALIEVYLEGDNTQKPFNFPKLNIHLNPEKLDDYTESQVFDLVSKHRTPYFIARKLHMPEIVCYQSCAYIMPLNDVKKDIMSGTLRGGCTQTVSVNLPHIAYEANGNDDPLFELLGSRMAKAREVLFLKMRIIEKNLENNLLPFMSQKVSESERYLEPRKQAFVISFVGLNEMIKVHTGCELHEETRFGLKVVEKMKERVMEYKEASNLNFTLASAPQGTWTKRLAQIDSRIYGSKAVVGKAEDLDYATSFHPKPNIPPQKKIEVEGTFHPLLSGGALTQIPLKEDSVDEVIALTKNILDTPIQYYSYTRA